ncbi:MAG: SDR family oxidoreductase [Chloroflexi bacterium]|nr:SDR family oxidoreductase [Chloroflexota bacterium]
MDLGLKGRVMLAAGASKGLGYGIAQALARDGARVSICSRSEADINAAADKLRADTGAEVIATACDVRKMDEIERWVTSTVEQWGTIDGLLVNAGGPPAGFFSELTDEQWQAAFELTLLSSIRMIRAALPHMQAGSAILAITSSSVQEPIERLGLSTVMRSGVTGLVKTLADELAPKRIRINTIVPGRIDTDRVTQLDQISANRSGKSLDEVRRGWESAIPFGRYGTIEEFGAAGAFLLSPAAAYITGTDIRVDGGKGRII